MESVFAQSSLGDLVAKFKKNKIAIPTWQREQGVWSTQKKTRLIDTIVRGWYMPPIVLWSQKNKRYVVDGLQRLSTIRDFMDDIFKVSIDGKRLLYSQLTQERQFEFEERVVFVATIRGDDRSALEQFFRLNEKPAVLSQGEIYLGFHDCPAMRAIRELSRTRTFVEAVGFSELNEKRLQPAEWLVNWAAVMRSTDGALTPRRKQFCATASTMKDADLKVLSEQFDRLNKNLSLVFTKSNPFRRGPLNRAAFLAIAPWLCSIHPDQLAPIKGRVARLYDELITGSVIGAVKVRDPKGVVQEMTFADATGKGPDAAWKLEAAANIWNTQADAVLVHDRYQS